MIRKASIMQVHPDKTAACQKWWAFMQDIMPSNPDNSPISEPLTEVFYLA